MRRGELLGLAWDDVDLRAGEVTVRRTLQRTRGKVRLVEPKTRASRRRIPLLPSAVRALRIHRLCQRNEERWAWARWEDSGLVFTTTIGTPLDPSEASRAFRRAAATK